MRGILRGPHFFCQNSPFSVTSLPMISFSFVSIRCMYCGPLTQAQGEPRKATLPASVSKSSRVLDLLWAQYLPDRRNQGRFLLLGQAGGDGISLEMDCPCPGGIIDHRHTFFSDHPSYHSPLLKCFKYIRRLPVQPHLLLICFKTPTSMTPKTLCEWKRYC